MRCKFLAILFCAFLTQAIGVIVTSAQEPKEEPKRVTINPFPVGVHRYEPGKWASVGLRIRNYRTIDTEKHLSLFGNQETRLQYARRMWVPAQSMRESWVPFHVLNNIPVERKSLDLNTLSFASSQSNEVVDRQGDGQLIAHSLLPIDRSHIKTAVIFSDLLHDSDGSGAAEDEDAYQLLVASKAALSASRVAIEFHGNFFPRTTAAYEGMDHLILCGDRLRTDSAGLVAIRRWLEQGGRLWIMLDRISQETVMALLGDATCCEIVNRTELTEFTIEDMTPSTIGPRQDTWRSDHPVSFVEVLTDGADIHCQINGWPAAFWKRIGRGEVLFTTLGPRGWMYQRNPFADDPDRYHAPGPTQALESISVRMFDETEPSTVNLDVIRPSLLEQIGYRIPSRRLAIAVLASVCIGLLAAGGILHLSGKQWHLAWLVPAIGLIGAGFMFALGLVSTHQVPDTAAFLQILQVTPETGSVDCRSLVAFYSNRTRDLPLVCGPDVSTRPELSDLEGVVKRITWDDSGQSSWSGVTLKPRAVRFAEVRSPLHLTERVRATGTFDSNGFSGRVSGEIVAGLENAVVTFAPAPTLSVAVDETGGISGGPDKVLAPSQFLSNTILSDEQRRRQEIYREVLAAHRTTAHYQQPMLHGWRPSIPLATQVPEGMRSIGSALLSIPLDIKRVAPGEHFAVPATFIRIQYATSDSGVSMVYDARSNQWAKAYSFPTKTRLRFVLPEQVRPCQLSRATLSFKVDIPSRSLRVQLIGDQTNDLIFEEANSNGVFQVEIDDESKLALDEFGGLVFDIEVTDFNDTDQRNRDRFEQSRTWQIDYFRINVEGQAVQQDESSRD